MARRLLALAALGLSLQAAAPAAPAGDAVVVCTAEGPRTVRLDGEGRPLGPAPADRACAHLWCEPRRQRIAGRSRG